MEMNNEKQQVTMSPEEMEAFKRFRENEAKEKALAEAKGKRDQYRQMVDDEIAAAIPELMDVSGQIGIAKKTVMDNFKAIIELKEELFRLEKGKCLENKSHTFTNSKGNMRITLGKYETDGYLDTAEDGIRMVHEYIESLASDAKSKALVNMVLKLLSKDSKGTLKASRIIQLRKMAEETGDDSFIEGVRIIEESYTPVVSKTYIRAEVKDDNGMWKNIPLGMTES